MVLKMASGNQSHLQDSPIPFQTFHFTLWNDSYKSEFLILTCSLKFIQVGCCFGQLGLLNKVPQTQYFKNRNFLSSHSRGQKSKNKMFTGLFFLRGMRERSVPSLAPWPFSCSHGIPPVYVFVSKFPPFIGTPVIVD